MLHHPWTDDEIVSARCTQSPSLTITYSSSAELAKKCQSHSNFRGGLSCRLGGGGSYHVDTGVFVIKDKMHLIVDRH